MKNVHKVKHRVSTLVLVYESSMIILFKLHKPLQGQEEKKSASYFIAISNMPAGNEADNSMECNLDK